MPFLREVSTDHLGNVRVVATATGVIEQQNEFYPYGESIDTGAQFTSDNPYKWGGKEWDADQGAYDFGARMYSPADARWSTMDPLCEKYYHISPYAYCAGNPVNYVDMDGCKYDEYYSSINGKYLGRDAYGGSLRLINPKDYNRIAGTQTNVQLIPYIQELRGSSRLIVSKANHIEHDAQMVADQSREDRLEHQCYFVLDRETASIYTIDGPFGDNSSSTINYYPATNTGCSFVDHPGGLILIGEMHGHPASNAIGHQTLKTMSPDKDVPLAKKRQIPIWGIDAMDGSKGDSMGVHVAFPSGEVRNNVRQTSKSFEDWGYEALRIWGRSGFPIQ